MFRARTLAAASLAFTGAAMLAQPAAASLGVAALPMAVAASAFANPAACRPAIAPAAGLAQPIGVPVQSKSAAILGGGVSQLDLIRQQQSGTLTAAPAALALVRTLEPAAGVALAPRDAAGACAPSVSFVASRPVLPGPAAVPSAAILQPAVLSSPDNFLASKRLPIGRTSFDRDWARVSAKGFSGSAATRLTMINRGAPGLAELSAVNSWTNAKIRYVEDRELYGKADYWATAGETLRRRAGDCEDIAIAKMQLLAALGVPRSAMYLTIARDTVRASDHAVLVVRMGDKAWLLDNATDRVLDAGQSYDYRPIVSFSDNKRWIHGY